MAEKWVENCVGLTGWTLGLKTATANFAAGIARSAVLAERKGLAGSRPSWP